MMFLLKYPIIIANNAANILGLFSKSKDPVLSKNIGGKIIAGKIAAGTKDKIFFVFLLKEDILNYKMKKILSYVPSAIFPAIIFPPIFLDNSGSLDLENNPKILAAIFAILVGYLSKNIIATIFAGLTSYWFLIFVV